MASKAELITAAVAAALIAGPQTPAGSRVYRNRAEPFVRDDLPAISIIKASDIPNEPGAVGRVLWTLTLELRITARDPTAPDAAVDPTLVAVHDRMYNDRTLGGLAVDVQIGQASYRQDEEVKETCTVTREYRILYTAPEEQL